MVEKITISRIGFFDKDKQGNQLKNKDGKPYTRCLIDSTDGRKISGFRDETNTHWKQGDEVEIDVEQKGEYWNFKMLKANKAGVNQEQIDRIEKMVTEIYRHVVPAQSANKAPSKSDDF